MILSTHIDDLKGGGKQKWVDMIVTELEKAFGKIKKQLFEFEHCGIMHKQRPDKSVEMTMDHYLKDLRVIPLTKEIRSTPDIGCDD